MAFCLKGEMADVLGAKIVGTEEAIKRCSLRCCLDRWPAFSIFAFHQTDNSNHPHSSLACRFDCVHRGSSGGANVIHDHHGRVRLQKALNPTPGAVSLFGLPHQKAIQNRGPGSLQGVPGTGRGYITDDGVGTEREPAALFSCTIASRATKATSMSEGCVAMHRSLVPSSA